MDYSLECKGNVFPCEVIIDEDNGRYMIRKEDSSGEIFNCPEELVSWIIRNWDSSKFYNQDQFEKMLEEIKLNFPIDCCLND